MGNLAPSGSVTRWLTGHGPVRSDKFSSTEYASGASRTEIKAYPKTSWPGSHARQSGGPLAEFILSKVEGLRTGVGAASAGFSDGH
jgi:hypothetical protein